MNRAYLKKSCEEIDAAVFSGDTLYDDCDRVELKEYVARWTSAIDEFEADPETEAMAPLDTTDSDIRETFGAAVWKHAGQYALRRDASTAILADLAKAGIKLVKA